MRGASGLYSVDDITQALQALLGESPPAVMPNPTSPTAVIIWLPLVLVAGTSMFHAYLIWMVLSIALLCSVISSSVSRSHLSAQTAAMITCGMFLSLLSNVAQSSAMLGQSSVFATGVLGLLALRLAHRDASDSPDIVLASLLFLSSLKLPYFIIALGMLTVERCWKAIALCGVCLGLCFLIGAWWSSPEWMAGYGATIVRYAFGRFSEGGFYWGDFQSETATWDHISQDLIPSGISAAISWPARILGLIGLTVVFVRAPRIAAPRRVYLTLRILLATYLIFSSYLGYYEQLLLVLCPLIAVGTGQSQGWRTLVSLLLVYVALSDRLFSPLLSFVCKVLVLAI